MTNFSDEEMFGKLPEPGSQIPLEATGMLTINLPRYRCPVHGDIGQATVQFLWEGWSSPQFCVRCISDLMVRSGVHVVERIKPQGESDAPV